MIVVGADPELFLQTLEGKLRSSVGLIGGTKTSPRPISEDGHAVQEDNVSVEFNIPPSDSAEKFVHNINHVLAYLKGYAAEKGLVFSKLPAASFPEEELMTMEAQVFGCEPDFNAYTLEANPRPFCADLNLRSCGGHVHVATDLDKAAVVKAMDIFLGVPSVFLDSGDASRQRRMLYGKAGAHRPKAYGVEYRTLSNFWIWDSGLIRWVYEQTEKALDFVKTNRGFTMDDVVQQAINGSDKHAAQQVLDAYGVAL